ncbi:hypothetical protein EES43_01870 [Streptomyces sp. ADI96-02]|uniref:hypothetical protein n=1 Tax=unclassified Streptomyces TaxID=2593676 RepID=UPI000F5593B8|nr:hypothetical protein [Streptomyces sp. ADI96-02]RPK68176.1 hypothetical protein EES43_01870 [Streptomyces sp. ADI96-02]
MGSGIADADGRDVRVEAVAGEAGRVTLRLAAPAGGPPWSCAPDAARRLAAALVRAAEEAESAPAARPVRVEAGELRRGDVRDGDRAMTVESVRGDGSAVHVTWTSGAGRRWTQTYDVGAAVSLRRRLPEGR